MGAHPTTSLLTSYCLSPLLPRSASFFSVALSASIPLSSQQALSSSMPSFTTPATLPTTLSQTYTFYAQSKNLCTFSPPIFAPHSSTNFSDKDVCERIGTLTSAGSVPTLAMAGFDENIFRLLYATRVSDSFLALVFLKAGTMGGFLGQDGDHGAQVVDGTKRSSIAWTSVIRRPRMLRSSS